MRVLVVIALLAVFSSTAKAEDLQACPEAEWVSFSVRAPYTPEVAAAVPSVWLTQLFLPCPFVGWSLGHAQLPLAPTDSASFNIAIAHTVLIAICWLPAVFSVVGIPLLLLEEWYIAPVTTLNNLDRDMRCAKAPKKAAAPSPSPSAPAFPPAKITAPPPPKTTTEPKREDSLPPPPALPPPQRF